MKSLAFIDFENTITFKGEKLSKSTLEKINHIEKSYQICLVSSSFESDIEKFLNENNLTWDYIADGGATIKINNTKETKTFKVQKSNFLDCQNDILFFFYEDNEILYRFNFQKRLENIYPRNNNIIDLVSFDFIPQNFTQLIICLKSTSKEKFLTNIEANTKTIIENEILTILKITPKNINKASFMKKVIEYYQTDYEHTIAFGDSEEDLEVFKNVKIKVAVENAVPPLKQEADYQVQNYKEDGVFNFLVLFDDPSTLQ